MLHQIQHHAPIHSLQLVGRGGEAPKGNFDAAFLVRSILGVNGNDSHRSAEASQRRVAGAITLISQHLLKNHQVVTTVGIPADADNVVAQGDGQMEHGPVLVVAFKAD